MNSSLSQHSLSVVLAVYDEEENIARCLESIKAIADEIIIIDGGSTDQTVQIAQRYKANITITTNPPIFHINKQKGIDQAKGEWILQLDADEVVSQNLAQEIKKIIAMSDQERQEYQIPPSKNSLFQKHQTLLEQRDGRFFDTQKPIAGYFLPRTNMFLGRAMKYAGMYPDGVIRLIKNGFAHFPSKSVHEQIQIDGNVAWLEHELLHYDSPTFEKYLLRANRYTTLTAQKMKADNTPINAANFFHYAIIKPIITFLNLYLRHKGILDGFPGFVFSLFSGLHFCLAYMKYASNKV